MIGLEILWNSLVCFLLSSVVREPQDVAVCKVAFDLQLEQLWSLQQHRILVGLPLLAALLRWVVSALERLADHTLSTVVALVAVALHALSLRVRLIVVAVALVALTLVLRLQRLVRELLMVCVRVRVFTLLALAVHWPLLVGARLLHLLWDPLESSLDGRLDRNQALSPLASNFELVTFVLESVSLLVRVWSHMILALKCLLNLAMIEVVTTYRHPDVWGRTNGDRCVVSLDLGVVLFAQIVQSLCIVSKSTFSTSLLRVLLAFLAFGAAHKVGNSFRILYRLVGVQLHWSWRFVRQLFQNLDILWELLPSTLSRVRICLILIDGVGVGNYLHFCFLVQPERKVVPFKLIEVHIFVEAHVCTSPERGLLLTVLSCWIQGVLSSVLATLDSSGSSAVSALLLLAVLAELTVEPTVGTWDDA